MKVLNELIDLASLSKEIRALMRYVARRSDGLQYGSYNLADEVALAVSFASTAGKGGAVIDAGANKGDWSRQFLAAIQPRFSGGNLAVNKLVLIEPQSVHMQSLQKLCTDPLRIVIEQVAIGAGGGPGQLTLYSDTEGSGLSSLYCRDLTHVGAAMTRQEVVKVKTLDTLVKKHEINHITYLKLDLEGHELEALKGAQDLLDRHAIDAITFEFGGCNIDSRTYFKDFWSLLVYQHQFRFYRLLPKRRLKRIRKYTESLEQFSWQNILACAPGIEAKWKVLD